MKKLLVCAVLFSQILFWGCGSDQEAREQPVISASLDRLSRIYPLPEQVKAPANNPMTSQKVELGRLLFFDPILSGDRDIACATCHHPRNGFAESRDISIGTNGQGFGGQRTFRSPNDIPFVKRNAHTVLNTAFNGINLHRRYDPEQAPMFWDSRVSSLEAQALEPIKALEEMRGRHYSETEILQEVVDRLDQNATYRSLFAEAFPASDPAVSAENLAKAIATYERSLVGGNSRFDRFRRGDKSALSESEQAGMQKFIEVGCAQCHNGPMFSDFKMHVLGVPDHPGLPERDLGTGDTLAFRTPTLRNLRFTFPFMHNGTFKSTTEILEFYEDLSMGKSRNPNIPIDQIDPLARGLTLKARDFGPINNFLLSLNDDDFDQTVPESVPSGLPVGGNID